MVDTMAVLINLSNAAAAARIKELQAAAGILGVSLLGFSTGRHRRPCLDVPADRNVDGAWDAGGPGCARPWHRVAVTRALRQMELPPQSQRRRTLTFASAPAALYPAAHDIDHRSLVGMTALWASRFHAA
jgi:hypothetical protein